ncbi:MAG: phosphatidylinositol-specific phospholipase C/glycerophosphodiester phosphodiesterase family protein [Cytophagales bacterium]|nr:phosphatidylinositol-specific phospholipase C/glycerophosphodiester phosphodiesterase family protein [Cytophagales bacterium]
MKLLSAFFLIISASGCLAQVIPLPNAHAHNDYEHTRPLMDALENGFTSVEADVFLVDDILYVYHDLPAVLDRERTLENLYLKPLQKIIEENEGYVYPGYEKFFYLMIDFKSEAAPAYKQLKKLLGKYRHFISAVKKGIEETGKPVKIFLSGSASGGFYEVMLQEDILLAGVDGRPIDLGKGLAASVMPVISDHYRKFLSWDGKGAAEEKEVARLRTFVKEAHAEGKKVRLWAAPDLPQVWAFLLKNGVDLINTDNLSGLKGHLVERGSP